jgi:hypothetical protein
MNNIKAHLQTFGCEGIGYFYYKNTASGKMLILVVSGNLNRNETVLFRHCF